MNNSGQFFIGVVEDRADPLKIGRCKVRVVGLHNYDKTILPTSDLPWAMLMQPASSASSSGIGSSAIGPIEGTTVIVVFHDYPDCQQPIIIGALPGIQQGKPVHIDQFPPDPVLRDDITPEGRKIPTNAREATAYHVGPTEGVQNPVLSQLTNSGNQFATSTPMSILGTFLGGGSAASYASVGGLLTGLNVVGSTYSPAANALAGVFMGKGNSDQAISQFKSMFSQSTIGLGITNLMNGKGSLQLLQQDLGLNLNQIQNQFNSIKNVNISDPASVLGLMTNVSSLATQAGTLLRSGTGILQNAGGFVDMALGTNIGSTIGATLGGTVTALTGLTGGISGLIGGAFSWVGRALAGDFSAFNFNSLGNLFGNPAIVSDLLVGDGTSNEYTAQDGGLRTIKSWPNDQTLGTIDRNTFKDIPEGQSFPINGVFGGPNSSGQVASINPPQVDMSRYEGGSKGNIKTTPPSDWRGDTGRATQGIQALLNSCQKWQFNTNEQKAALLGIVGGECGWIPQPESCQYTNPERLNQIFQTSFRNDLKLAEQYCNWTKGNKGTREEFFNFVYDPSRNGRQLGNTRPGDGGKYYGRGFIQLTGRANYERYAKMSGHDIVNNPNLLNDDINVSADIAVLYLKDRTKDVVPTAHPGFFYAAKKAVGNNCADIAARKLKYYEHFYGTQTPETIGYTDKIAGNENPPNSFEGCLNNSKPGQADLRYPKEQGFCDPNAKYPLSRHTCEPDTHRLARGVIKETIVPLKDSQRRIGIPMANNKGSFSQPTIPYGAVYPFNNVVETESGHVQEFDDTPGYERVHTYHKSGTFDEIDANGTKVTRIVGDGYTIVDRNGYIAIDGECALTVGGHVSIYCRSDADIEVAGSAEMKIGGNFDIGVARDMNVAVGGKFSLWSNGGMNLQTEKKAHIMSNDNMYITTNREMHQYSILNFYEHTHESMHTEANKNIYIESLLSTHIKAGTDFFTLSGASTHIKADASLYLKSNDTTHVKGGVNRFQSTSGVTYIRAAGDFAVDAPRIDLNSNRAGGAIDASRATPADTAIKALINGMTPPVIGTPLYPDIEHLSTPPMHGEESYMYESDQAGQSTASQWYNTNKTAQQGKGNLYQSEIASGSGGGGSIIPSKNQEKILATGEFTADFRLSEHFTLGMMFDGGFNIRHRLVDQNGLTKQQIVANLAALCENILEKYLTVLPGGINGLNKTWKISSGYRMGTNNSDHSKGRACDIALIGGRERKPLHHELIQKLDKLVPYDQLILEYEGTDSTWIHTGFRGDGKTTFGGGANRKMAFTMNNHKTYGQGFILLG